MTNEQADEMFAQFHRDMESIKANLEREHLVLIEGLSRVHEFLREAEQVIA